MKNIRNNTLYWLELVLGAVFVALGIFTLTKPASILNGFVIIYGLAAMISGIRDIYYYILLEKKRAFASVSSLSAGVLNVLAGLLFLINIDSGKFSLSVLFPLWFLFHCVSRLISLSDIRYTGGSVTYMFLTIMNISGAVLSIVLMFNPLISTFIIGYIIGICLILLGISSIALSLNRLDKK